MDFWTAVIAIVSIGCTLELVKYAIKMKHSRPVDGLKPGANAKLEQLEKRIESLESIIIDLEKDKRFRDL